MNSFSLLVQIILFVFFFLFTTRPLYLYSLKVKAGREAKKLGLDLPSLTYSYEQMVFFTALPSHLPQLKEARMDHVKLKLDYHSLFFPRFKGVKVMVEHEEFAPYVLAYLPIKGFRLPSLDRLEGGGLLDADRYLIISSYIASHPSTKKEIQREVFRRLQFESAAEHVYDL
ncbi:hypothetical protein [Jeotgalibacillus sp. R-1-5s-1]|uniref:hypothetical protein n=1 Tax=Jeotgalibacillus sp. R-1-5s-1 TaxID=2555897 RepID=UPI00106BB2D7|nr:hypothetical protein [Jeotgalibacillus sp. R-1-5s-1]TFE00059.1 hypothetical protein E2491_06345 [Jeotgalibacillus sp. R-1-5s-1]